MDPVKYLKKYLKIKSVHPNPDYDSCIDFLTDLSVEINLSYKIFKLPTGKKVFVLTWNGDEKESILLNSHMDVVPVYLDKWTQDPWAANEIDGKIYARGAQDMKSVGICHIFAVKKLIEKGIKPKKTVHISFVPDEEIGGADGMQMFVKTNFFQNLNVIFALDESAAVPDDKYLIFNCERTHCCFNIQCTGTTGHGSLLHENTSGEKLKIVLDEIMDFRQTQVDINNLKGHPLLFLGHVTTVNLTKIEGGVQNNVVPPEITATFDCRLSITTDVPKFKKMITQICEKAGKGTFVEYIKEDPQSKSTLMDNQFCQTMTNILDKKKKEYYAVPCAGCTDARFLREIGIPALGFTPLKKVELLLHANDEYITIETFLEGIDIMADILEGLILETNKPTTEHRRDFYLSLLCSVKPMN